jgi:hypothetical protein
MVLPTIGDLVVLPDERVRLVEPDLAAPGERDEQE